jgi:hypothetical protein
MADPSPSPATTPPGTTPAVANNDVVTLQGLATVLGASIIALGIAQAVKIFRPSVSDQTCRQIALVAGLVLVPVATFVLNQGLDGGHFLLALVVGLQAGLAAAKTREFAVFGVQHIVQRFQ